MGRIEKVKSFFREVYGLVKTDSGGGALITAQRFADAGDDSQPLTTDYAITVETEQEGRRVVVGFIDPINKGKSGPGEKRIVGRKLDGEVVAEVWLKDTGEILVANSQGEFKLEPGGDCVINGATITKDGEFVNKLGISLGGHGHPITGGSSAPGPTGVSVEIAP